MKTYLELLEESLPAPDHPRYAAWRAYALSGEERAVPMVKRLQQFKDLATARVLDLGCGDGGLTVELARSGAEVVAIDVNPGSVVRTRARLKDRNVVATVALASAESLPFASSSIDVVVAQDVIEHVRDPIRVLREVNRVLRADGLCLISAPNGRAWTNIVSDPHWGLAGVTLMPRWLAERYVCRIRRRAQMYDVWHLPHLSSLTRWLLATGLQPSKKDLKSSRLFPDFRRPVITILAFKVTHS